MEKVVRIVKKGEDDSNLSYWLSLTEIERLVELKQIRQEVNQQKYGTRKGFQRVYRIVKLADKNKSYKEIPSISTPENSGKKKRKG
jgi:hypothetical protein